MRISDWSSDVCSSDLRRGAVEDIFEAAVIDARAARVHQQHLERRRHHEEARHAMLFDRVEHAIGVEFGKHDAGQPRRERHDAKPGAADMGRSEEHTSELQSLMRISYAVFCLKNKKNTQNQSIHTVQPIDKQLELIINTKRNIMHHHEIEYKRHRENSS